MPRYIMDYSMLIHDRDQERKLKKNATVVSTHTYLLERYSRLF